MKRIAIGAIKGGVGKTTVTCGLALALKRLGYKVGICEIDVTGSTVWKALGLSEPPPIGTDTAAEKIIPSDVDGLEVFTIASYFRAGGVFMWRGSDTQVLKDGESVTLLGTGKYSFISQMLRDVRFSDDLHFLLYDLPPTIGDELISLWDNLTDLWATIIVTQPTALSREGMAKTVRMLILKQLPLLGVVVNMDGVCCPNCGTRFQPFKDVEDLDNLGYSVISRIPFGENLDTYFDQIAKYVEQANPQKLGQISAARRVIDKVQHSILTRVAPVIVKRVGNK